MAAQRSVMVRLDALVTPYIASMGKASAATTAFARTTDAQLTASTKKATQLGTAAGALPGKFGALASVGGAAFAGVGLAIGAAVSKFADFEVAMDAVQASTGATGAELEQLGDTALKAAADTAFGAVEAARGIESLAKAGVSTTDIIGGGLKGALDLAAAGEIEVADAAEIAATAMTTFGLKGRDIPHIADLIAAAAGKAQGDVTELSMALKQSGLVAAQMGLSIEETTGTLAAFASAGLIGSDAGTSFRTMLLRLANPAGEAADLMDTLGINAYSAQGSFVGMASLAGQLRLRLAGLSQEQRDMAMATIFGSDAIRAANVLYEQGLDGIQNWESAVDDAAFAAEQAAIRTGNLRGDLERLGGELEKLALGGQAPGQGEPGFLRRLVQGAEDLAVEVNEEIELWRTKYLPTIGDVENAINDLLPDWLELPDVIDSTTESVERETQARELQNTEMQREATMLDRYTSAEEAAASQTALLTEEIEKQTAAAFDASEQFLSGRDAVRDWYASLEDATTALDENGQTLDVSTEKGRANQEALDGMADAALRVLEDMTASGQDTETAQRQMQRAIAQTAEDMGMEEGAAQDLAEQIINIPDQSTTDIVVNDKTAREKVKAWNQLIAAGGGQITVSITAIERAARATGGFGFVGFPLPGGAGRYRITQGPHDGGAIDYATRIGTPVYSTLSGYLNVTDLGNRSYGKYYTVTSGNRSELGAHLNAFARGDGYVSAGTFIGFSGNTGNSTGPHLHYLRNYHTGGWTVGGPINTLAGEYVVNPSASAANRGLLEAINAGRDAAVGAVELGPQSIRALGRVIAGEVLTAVGAGAYTAGQRANMLART